MGLTNHSTGRKALDSGSAIKKLSQNDKIIALAGNPNVGKSTVFNGLTGLNQHTGNWPGKTVSGAQGYCRYKDNAYILVDIPGTYSLKARSREEEVARDLISFGGADAVIVVCDATCLERNMNLVLQTIEITENVLVCVNLMDEAKKKSIRIDLEGISNKLGVPVIGITATNKKSLNGLLKALDEIVTDKNNKQPIQIRYTNQIEGAISLIEPVLRQKQTKANSRWLSINLLDYDETLISALNKYLGFDIFADGDIRQAVEKAVEHLRDNGITKEDLSDRIAECLIKTAEDICSDTVLFEKSGYHAKDRKIDRILTSKWAGIPVMAAMLLFILWLTITGANYPSRLLSDALFYLEDWLSDVFILLGAPAWLRGMLIQGAYRVLSWVVSVMLPPMAIFFPLFTLLEDLGYLPRVAFILDKYFKKCSACGKQALTMCMGFGCNAAGVIGCRIIDSPRERLIATITNSFVPCNGRFPPPL